MNELHRENVKQSKLTWMPNAKWILLLKQAKKLESCLVVRMTDTNSTIHCEVRETSCFISIRSFLWLNINQYSSYFFVQSGIIEKISSYLISQTNNPLLALILYIHNCYLYVMLFVWVLLILMYHVQENATDNSYHCCTFLR